MGEILTWLVFGLVGGTTFAWYRVLSGEKEWRERGWWLLIGLVFVYGLTSVRQPLLTGAGREWIKNNLSLALDPNYYFFANHPRERSGWTERELLPYWLLPFWLVGVVSWRKQWKREGRWLWGLPLLTLTLAGFENRWGGAVMLPWLLVGIIRGGKMSLIKLWR